MIAKVRLVPRRGRAARLRSVPGACVRVVVCVCAHRAGQAASGVAATSAWWCVVAWLVTSVTLPPHCLMTAWRPTTKPPKYLPVTATPPRAASTTPPPQPHHHTHATSPAPHPGHHLGSHTTDLATASARGDRGRSQKFDLFHGEEEQPVFDPRQVRTCVSSSACARTERGGQPAAWRRRARGGV